MRVPGELVRVWDRVRDRVWDRVRVGWPIREWLRGSTAMLTVNPTRRGTMTRPIRQGDILLVPAAIPEGLKERKGRLVLATGESTGHAHVIERGAVLYGDALDNTFLQVLTEGGVDLVHTSNPVEHDTLTVPPGTYKVTRQREYTPEAIRNVAD